VVVDEQDAHVALSDVRDRFGLAQEEGSCTSLGESEV
jgi:hypothetical protein